MNLFIGGPLDGQLIEVEPTRNHVEVAIKHPLELNSAESEKTPKMSTLTDIFYYKREVLSCPSANFSLFVPRSYSCMDVMLALIEGYHQGAVSTNE